MGRTKACEEGEKGGETREPHLAGAVRINANVKRGDGLYLNTRAGSRGLGGENTIVEKKMARPDRTLSISADTPLQAKYERKRGKVSQQRKEGVALLGVGGGKTMSLKKSLSV